MIANLGYGAIGGLLMARCVQNGLTAAVISRDGHGIHLKAKLMDDLVGDNGGKFDIDAPVDALPIENLDRAELIIVAVKSHQVIPFFQNALDRVPARLPILLLHNGMGPQQWVKQHLPNNPLLVGTTSHSAIKQSDGSIVQTGIGETQLGWAQGQSTLKPQLTQAIEELVSPVTWHRDINQILWLKLAVNACINPITAIEQIPNGDLKHRVYRDEIALLCHETAQVMQTEGLQTSALALIERVNRVIAQTADNLSSMNRDIYHGRRTEIDAITGFLLTKAKALGLSLPHHIRRYEQVKALEQIARLDQGR